MIATGLPYEVLVKKLGGQAPARRGSVMKLMGDASLLPPGMTLGGERLTSSGNHGKMAGSDEMSFGVTNNANLPNKSQLSILEGTERFLRATEMVGKYLLDLKDYSH